MSDTSFADMSPEELIDRPEIVEALFHPIKIHTPPPEGAVDLDITVAEGVQIGCRFFSHSKEAPTIIFFHGNGETVPDYDEIGPFYVAEGMNFLVADYRGYGWSTGSPLVSALLSDCQTVFTQAKKYLAQEGYTGYVFVMGRSMGSSCAIDIAWEYSDKNEEHKKRQKSLKSSPTLQAEAVQAKKAAAEHRKILGGLIIESGFAQTLPVARLLGVDLRALGITEEQTFNNEGKMADITVPTFIYHGQNDNLIPFWQAEKLHGSCGAKTRELVMIPGADHNTMIAVGGRMYFQVLKKFIDKITGDVPDWRERRRKFKEEQKKKQQSTNK